MSRRGRILALVDAGVSYEEIGARLGISAGLAYLIATGLPADGSDAPSAAAHERPGFLPSSQHLANPPSPVNPTSQDTVRRWMRHRVESDPPLRTAAAARDAVPPQQPTVETTVDVVDLLVRDHNQVNAMLKQLSTIPGAAKGGTPAQRSSRVSIVDLVSVALSRHESAEEKHLWPAVRALLPDGDRLADAGLEQEQHGKDVLQALARLDGEDDAEGERFDELVEELVASCRKHVAFEERIFLRLRESVPRDELVDLGRRLDRARRHGPTRPHPDAPDRRPGVDVAGAAGTAIDRVRDALGSRPADRRGTSSEAARRRTGAEEPDQDAQEDED